MKKLFTSFLTLAFAALFFTTFGTQKVEAQDFGADVASSYVWRGTQFGNGPHVQPWMSLGYGNLELGAWGSVPLTAGDSGAELDLYVSLLINVLPSSKMVKNTGHMVRITLPVVITLTLILS